VGVAAGGTWKLFGACVRVFGEEISRVCGAQLLH